MSARLDLDDIQGLFARGYGDLPSAAYVLVSMGAGARAGPQSGENGAHSRAWLGSLAPAVTSARGRPGREAVNVAFTAGGLSKLGLGPELVDRFSAEFSSGMVAPHRSRVLGDIDECAPEGWAWGGPGTEPVDAVLMLYAPDDAALATLRRAQGERLAEHGLHEVRTLDTADLDGIEPFGFRDSISQPIVEGLSKSRSDPANTVAAGEFVLGYPNEYNRFTARPVLSPDDDPARVLPSDAAGSGGADLGRNGSYLVFRQLAQDPEVFWEFVEDAAARLGGAGDPEAATRLAAKMVGRWPSGAPLVLAPDADDPALADANDFAYYTLDRDGMRCPIGAHVRRSHPRDSLDPQPGSNRSVAVGNRHRILRRGREFGAPMPLVDAASQPGGATDRDAVAARAAAVEVGLHFICLNANISRQFEFVQHSWINNPNFAGLHNEPDPITAPTAGADFRIPASPVRLRVSGVPRFVTPRGGAYFFLPGLRALRFLASRTAGP